MARLLQGSREIGVLLIGNNGYGFNIPEYLAEEGALTVQQYCEEVGAMLLLPFDKKTDKGLIYDPITHRVTVVDVEDARVIVLHLL